MIDDIMFGRSGSGDNNIDVDPKDAKIIQDMLDPDEILLMTARQNGAFRSSSNVMFATNKRLLVRNPAFFGIQVDVEEYPYDQITSITLSKELIGAGCINFTMPGVSGFSKTPGLSEAIKLIPGAGLFGVDDTTGRINGIPKDKAEKMFNIIRARINDAKEKKSQPSTVVQQQQQLPLDLLKTKFVNGEITSEEYEAKKKILE